MKSNTKFLIPSFLALVLSFFLVSTAFAGPVSQFGKLKVCQVNGKGYICGEKTGQSTPVFFKGPSLYWSSGEGVAFFSPETVDWFVDNMQIGIIRAAMTIESFAGDAVKGYKDNPDGQKAIIKTVIDAAIMNDIYVVVDWHSHNAHTETNIARDFFVEIANTYKDVPNIIWEVYNEPLQISNAQVNSHAKTIINALKGAGNTNLVIIGSPNWSQDASGQASNYGSAASAMADNVAFVFHFYAGEGGGSGHNQVRTNANDAISAGYTVFGSEWGAVEANGGGGVNTSSSNTWTNWMDDNKITNCMWNASSVDEGSSMFKTETTPLTLSTTSLTTSGQYFQNYMRANKWTIQIPAGNPKAGDYTTTVKDGQSVTMTATNLGIDGEITSISPAKNTSGDIYGEAEVSNGGIKYTTSQAGSPSKVRFTYIVTKGSKTTQGRVTVNITDLKPTLPPVAPISVSKKAPTKLSLINSLKAVAPKGDEFMLTEVSISDDSKGTVTRKAGETPAKGDTIVFTPSVEMGDKDYDEVTVSYTVKNQANVTSTANVVLHIQNQIPTLQSSTAYCTATIEAGVEETKLNIVNHFGGKDKDDDSLWFDAFYLASDYPGSLSKVAPDTLVYNREGNSNSGKVVLLAYANDGSATSALGKVCITLKGNGGAINVTAPTEIPGYVPIISNLNNRANFDIKYFRQNIQISFAQNGFAKLDVYTLSGKNIGTLLNSYQNSGTKEISLKSLNLQKGVYILRLKQGSQVKTLRIVN